MAKQHDVVNNETYGLGVVLESDARRTTVDFDEAGVKTYDTAIASSVASLPELGEDYDIETWQDTLLACHERDDANWTIGDALVVRMNQTEKKKHADILKQASMLSGKGESSVKGYWRVARVFPKKSRHTDLSFSHHELVAGIKDPNERERWLALAETEKWNSEEFRLKVRGVDFKKESFYLPVSLYLELKAEMDAVNRERNEQNHERPIPRPSLGQSEQPLLQ